MNPKRPTLVGIPGFSWDPTKKSVELFAELESLADPGTARVKFWEQGETIVIPPHETVFCWYARVAGVEYGLATTVGRAWQVYDDFAFRQECLLTEAVHCLREVRGC